MKLICASLLFLLVIVSICVKCSANENTFALTTGQPANIFLAFDYGIMPYGFTQVKYKKNVKPTLLFKTSAPNFKNEGVPILNLGDVALFKDKICIIRRTKKNFVELEVLVQQCLEKFLFPDVPPSDFLMVPGKWRRYQRDEIAQQIDTAAAGIEFQFPESVLPDPNAAPPWDGYFAYVNNGRAMPTTATKLTLEFKITADSSVVWNYKSDPGNAGCDYAKASFRVYIAKGQVYADDVHHRWWYTVGFTLQNTPDVVKFSVPLAPDGWAGVFAGQAIDDVVGFQETLANSDWVGITFGGGCFYSHGVNTTYGKATFNFVRMYYE